MRNVRDYAIITATYWVFTITDGALRMLVLLHLHSLGYSPFEVASLFLLYEVFGVVTNFLGGWLGARFGLRSTLFGGLAFQTVALTMLAVASNDWLTVPYVMVAQALSGIAKDLTKMSAKSYIKLVVPDEDQHGLMRWVALLTGSKNTLKGVGFFLGGLMLELAGFQGACLAMLIGIVAALVTSWLLLPRSAGTIASKLSFKALICRNERVNWLSAARLFLFGSRDVWFVLALPIFLQTALGWDFHETGAFLALWVIGYGFVQAFAPRYVGGRAGSARAPPDARRVLGWTLLLVVPLGSLILALESGLPTAASLVVGLGVFGVVFATDSALHSYLIVAYAEPDKVSLRVGFYYMANAVGRLVGTVLSGAVFQAAGQGQAGLVACVAVSIGFVVVSAALCVPLRAAEARHDRAVATA